MSITITCRCPLCGNVSHILCEEKNWNKYQRGALAQEAFADMDIYSREAIISGMCIPCQIGFYETNDEDCDGECDICIDFDCPSNPHYDNPCNGEWEDCDGDHENCPNHDCPLNTHEVI